MSPVWDVVGLFAMRAAIYRMITDQGDDLYKTQISGIGRGMSTGVYYTHSSFVFLQYVIVFILLHIFEILGDGHPMGFDKWVFSK